MSEKNQLTDKLIDAYNAMAERASATLEHAKEGVDNINEAVDQAVETAVELDEMSRDEAERVALYLKRDLHDAGEHASREGHELADWFHMDMELIEASLLDLVSRAADPTTLDQLRFQLENQARQYQAGDITAPGGLQCEECGHVHRHESTGKLPVCTACGSTRFRRVHRGNIEDRR
jgi:hypothetical protein